MFMLSFVKYPKFKFQEDVSGRIIKSKTITSGFWIRLFSFAVSFPVYNCYQNTVLVCLGK